MPATVKVWDPLVRLFHWSLVTLFVIAYVAGDEAERLHLAAGYAITGLLALRIVWGFIGPRHARFTDFVRSPREAITYLRDALRLRARRTIGHNPAGGLIYRAHRDAGRRLRDRHPDDDRRLLRVRKRWRMPHELLANATVGLVALHLLGVLVASFEHRENLVKAMITGRKRIN